MGSQPAGYRRPAHSRLVILPIGLWAASLAWDAAFIVTRDPRWYHAASWTILAGVAAALLAAIPGFIDYFALHLSDRARCAATIHLNLNMGVALLFLVSLWVRADFSAAGAAFAWVLAISAVALLGLAASVALARRMLFAEGGEPAQDPSPAGALGGEAPAHQGERE